MKKFSVSVNGQVIGQTDLRHLDDGMRVRHDDDFVPTAAYENVRPVFQLAYFAAGRFEPSWRELVSDAYYAARDALNVQVFETASGQPVPGVFHLIDGGDLGFDVSLLPL